MSYQFVKAKILGEEKIIVSELGQIRKPIAIFFPNDIERLKKELKK